MAEEFEVEPEVEPEVELEPARRGRRRLKRRFGGYTITPDENLARVIGTTRPIPPSELTKRIWRYIKLKKLGR
jgi:chromatin remodeling complex protein RSC6